MAACKMRGKQDGLYAEVEKAAALFVSDQWTLDAVCTGRKFGGAQGNARRADAVCEVQCM